MRTDTKLLYKIFFICLLCFSAILVCAQDKTKSIGHKLHQGSTNNTFSVIKGSELGVKMNVGHKPAQLLTLNFHVDNVAKDTTFFKVNVYSMGDKAPLEKITSDDIKGVVIRNNKNVGEQINQLIMVDLTPYNIKAKGNILVAIEFMETKPNVGLGFSCGLLNGGSWYKKNPDADWKKIPVIGVDFNVKVKKLK